MLRRCLIGVVVGFGLLSALGYGSAWAADGRAYEMVSPTDKNGGDIPGDGVSVAAAADGNAISYASRASFGDTTGAGPVGQTIYVARRGPGGWQSRGATPTGSSAAYVSLGAPLLLDLSTDMRNGVVWADDLPGVTGALPTPNIYAEDTLTGDLGLVTQPLAGLQSSFAMTGDYGFTAGAAGVSDDSRHIAFTGSFTRLLPEAPVGVPSVYEWDNGTLRLASVLPDGTIASGGAVLASPNGAVSQTYRQTVSPDGSRVLFLSPTGSSAQLYERVDHSRTVWISQPETTGPPSTPQDVVLQQVTGDSRHVIFTTTSSLLDGDTNGGSDIYLYTDSANPTSDPNLTLVTNTGDIPGKTAGSGTAVVGSSDDASRIYYFNGNGIVAWHRGVTEAIADGVILPADITLGFSATVSMPGAARVTPDGRYVAFEAQSGVTSAGPKPLIGDSGGYTELYLYDAGADQLWCVSCPRSGPATADASVIPSVTQIFPSNFLAGHRPSFLASDGRVFFSTTQALVPEDVNGVSDVYEFDPATNGVKLISTGTGSEGAGFVDASRSGNDVFLVTRQRLVQADVDGYVDLYDARVGGGFPDQPPAPAPCDGDVCQGAVAPPPGAFAPGSLGFVDSGGSQAPASGARLRVLSARVVGTRADLRVAIPSAGGIGWTGAGLRRGSRRVSAAGTYRIQIDLTPRARAQIRHRGKLRVKVRIAFAPSNGGGTSTTASLTFKSSSSKKGR